MSVTPNSLLDLDPGIGQVQSTVLYRVLNRNLDQAADDVHPFESCSLTANSSAGGAKRQLSNMILGERDLRRIDLFSARIQPIWELEDGTQWEMGVFVFTDEALNEGSRFSTLNTTMVDMDYILDQGIETPWQIAPGGSITAGVNFLLDDAGIWQRSVPVDDSKVVPQGDPPTWAAGTSRLAILKQLCILAGWLPPYFNNQGVCVVRPAPSLTTDDPDHTYSNRRVARDSVIVSSDLLRAPNVFVVIGTGPSKGDISAFARVDARLPWSVERRGFKIVDVYRTQGLRDSAQAQQIADARALGAASGFRNLSFKGPPDPRHDLFDTVFYSHEQTTYREVSWGLKLEPGAPMSHTMTRGGFSA